MDTEPSARVSPEQPLTEYSALEVKSHTASSLGYEGLSPCLSFPSCKNGEPNVAASQSFYKH